MLTIWGRDNSINVQKAMWAVGELGLAHERIDVGGAFGKTKDEPYLSMNPNSLVPTMDDDGFILWESNAIVRYLARKHGKLEPKEAQACALANQWMDWQLTVVAPAIRDLFWGLIRTPPDQRDHAVIAESERKTTDAMRILDQALGRSAYVAGDLFSMGDIPVATAAFRFRRLAPNRPALPHLERWFAEIETRPAFVKHVSGIALT